MGSHEPTKSPLDTPLLLLSIISCIYASIIVRHTFTITVCYFLYASIVITFYCGYYNFYETTLNMSLLL